MTALVSDTATASAKVPLYLLADRKKDQATLFSDPVGNDYTALSQVLFGGSIKLPNPFSFTLETEDFAA